MDPHTPLELIDRESELAAIDSFLERVPNGPVSLLVRGEAGIGKSSLWEQAVVQVATRGFRVLSARPAENEASLPYSALTDLIGPVFDEAKAVLPAPQRVALETALLHRDDEAIDSRAIATGLVGLIAEHASGGPLLIAIDDVQWLDPASERAIAYAVRRLPPPTGLLVAMRTDGPMTPPLGIGRAMPRDQGMVVEPGPLSLAGVHRLLRHRSSAGLDRPMVARVAEASGGNPFFALEIASAHAGRQSTQVNEPLRLTPTLMELVSLRLGRLSPQARAVGEAAALMGRPTPEAVAAAVEGGDTFGALTEAMDAGVLLADGGRLRFVHPILASALAGSMTDVRRTELHRRLAGVVSDSVAAAGHLAAASHGAHEPTAARLEAAAELAVRRGGQETGAELFSAAARLTPEEDTESAARRLTSAAAAQLAVGELQAARSNAERAVELARDAGLRARALFVLGDLAWADGTVHEANGRLEEGFAVASGDAGLRSAIATRLVSLNVAIDPARAVQHAHTAEQLIDADRQPGTLAYVLFNRHFASALTGQGHDAQAFERALELERRGGADATRSFMPLIWYHQVDAFASARQRHEEEDAWYRERGEDAWRAERLSHRALVELRSGEWQLAERYAQESCDAIERFDAPKAWPIPFAWRSLVDAHRGRTDRARQTLLPLIEEAERNGRAWWVGLMLSVLAFTEYAAGDFDAAEGVLDRMHGVYAVLGVVEPLADRSEPFHIDILLRRGEVSRAQLILARLEERGRTLPRPWISISMPRARAQVLAAGGDMAAALSSIDSLDATSGTRLPFEWGWNQLVKGQLLRRQRQKRSAAAALREARDLFATLGAPAWLARADAELARVGLRHRSPFELTETERRVAELAAAGMTNRQVAEAAFMSPKTVEANLARVYRKLDIGSRAELGAVMARRSAEEFGAEAHRSAEHPAET